MAAERRREAALSVSLALSVSWLLWTLLLLAPVSLLSSRSRESDDGGRYQDGRKETPALHVQRVAVALEIV